MTDTVVAGATFGNWLVARVEGRAATVVCRCGVARTVTVEALMSGASYLVRLCAIVGTAA